MADALSDFAYHPDGRPPHMGDLTRLLRQDPTLRALWYEFTHGRMSLEQALVAMVVYQAERIERLTRGEVHRVLRTPAKTYIRTVSKPGTGPDHVVGPGDIITGPS